MADLWCSVFGNDRPVEVEIGPGTGTFLVSAAQRWPHINFFGIEHAHPRAAHLHATINRIPLQNARVIAADAACVIATAIPPDSVAAYHIYFPDPWWKRRHHRRRLFSPPFAAALARTLAPAGRVYVATDVEDVFTRGVKTLLGCGALSSDPHGRSPRTGVTVFERKGLARGAAIKEAAFIKWDGAYVAAATYASNAAPMTPAESPS